MNAQWQYKHLLSGYNNVHVLQIRNRKLNVIRKLTEQREEEESKRDICLRLFAMKRQ